MKTSILEEVKTTAVTEPLRVLIVEHSRLDVELILAQLKGIGTRFDATLVEDQQQFVRALRENDFGIILSDYRLPNWTGLDANPALLSILGCSQLEDLHALNLVRDVYRFPEQFLQHVADCRSRGLVHGAEAEWRRRDGGIITVRLHFRHLSDPGEADTMEFITEDVTELRAMERQLRQAQKFEAIGQLAGGVAHDFNNVIGAILGWAELGLDENQGRTKASERFARIKEQAERAAALTRELLAFSRRQV